MSQCGMRKLLYANAIAIALAASLGAACSDSSSGPADGGANDAVADDRGMDTTPDARVIRDSGLEPGDAHHTDLGFSDPDTIFEGDQPINGLHTYVRVMGTTTSTMAPLLFLHDGPALAHEYLPDLYRFLVPGHLLVFYDMRATGRTSFGTTTMTTTLTADRHAEDVEDVVDWIGTLHDSSKVDILGHGYGGGIAALYAAAHPERVRKLILTAPYPLTALELANYTAEAHSRITSGENHMINVIEMQPECRGNVNLCTIEIWRIEGPHYMCDQNRPLFRMMNFMYGDSRTADFIEFNLRDISYDWRPRIAQIQADTTVISGPCDPTPAEVAATYTSSIAGAQHFILDSSGHFPMLEQQSEYQSIVLHALRR